MNPEIHTHALVIHHEGMGQGDASLCQRLLQNYLLTLLELGTAPQSILCYAAGVKMATHDSPCRDTLDQLAGLGSQIILCRTCLDHYGLLDRVPDKEIGNMLMIIEAQLAAGKIITL